MQYVFILLYTYCQYWKVHEVVLMFHEIDNKITPDQEVFFNRHLFQLNR